MAVTKNSTLRQVIHGIAILVIVLAIWRPWEPTPPPHIMTEAEKIEDRKLSARGVCRIATERSLNDPGSAEWEPGSTWPAEVLRPDKIRVTVLLRAANGFGALMKAQFVCEVELSGENWTVTRFEQL